MGDIVELKPAHLEDDELIENLARFADGTLSEAAVKARHHLSNEEWTAMGESDRLVELVEACKLRRIKTGATKRERAQIEIVDGPPILGKIMRDPNANERHRIDSIKALDTLASAGAEAAAAGARFEITINLGEDTLKFSKSILPDPTDVDPNYPDDVAPPGRRPIADKPWNDDDNVPAPAKTPVKAIKQEPDELKSPVELALESMMKY